MVWLFDLAESGLTSSEDLLTISANGEETETRSWREIAARGHGLLLGVVVGRRRRSQGGRHAEVYVKDEFDIGIAKIESSWSVLIGDQVQMTISRIEQSKDHVMGATIDLLGFASSIKPGVFFNSQCVSYYWEDGHRDCFVPLTVVEQVGDFLRHQLVIDNVSIDSLNSEDDVATVQLLDRTGQCAFFQVSSEEFNIDQFQMGSLMCISQCLIVKEQSIYCIFAVDPTIVEFVHVPDDTRCKPLMAVAPLELQTGSIRRCVQLLQLLPPNTRVLVPLDVWIIGLCFLAQAPSQDQSVLPSPRKTPLKCKDPAQMRISLADSTGSLHGLLTTNQVNVLKLLEKIKVIFKLQRIGHSPSTLILYKILSVQL